MKRQVHILPLSERLSTTLNYLRPECWGELLMAALNAPTGTQQSFEREMAGASFRVDQVTYTVLAQLYKRFRLCYPDTWRLTWTHEVTDVDIKGNSLYIVMVPKPRRKPQE